MSGLQRPPPTLQNREIRLVLINRPTSFVREQTVEGSDGAGGTLPQHVLEAVLGIGDTLGADVHEPAYHVFGGQETLQERLMWQRACLAEEDTPAHQIQQPEREPRHLVLAHLQPEGGEGDRQRARDVEGAQAGDACSQREVEGVRRGVRRAPRAPVRPLRRLGRLGRSQDAR